MNEKEKFDAFIEGADKIREEVEQVKSLGAAKALLFCALLTMQLADKNGKIMELYEHVTECYVKATEKA